MKEDLFHGSSLVSGSLLSASDVLWLIEHDPDSAFILTWLSLAVHLCPNFPLL